MKKLIALFLIFAGAGCLSYGGWQLWSTNQLQANSLVEAKERITAEAATAKPANLKHEEGEVIGVLEIPKLERDISIIEGTTTSALKRGAGHYSGTAFPDGNDQIVFAGHRDTVFENLGELKKGDHLTVQMSYGTYDYVVKDSEVVDQDDLSIIHSTAPREELVLVTCYPFRFIGSAPDRYILYAERKM